MNFFFESLCKRVKCPTSQPGKIYFMFADFNYQTFVQLACSACHVVIHTFFCSYNEKQKYSPIIFSFRKYEHGYLAYENTAVSPRFFPLGTFVLAAKRDGYCRRLSNISLTSECSFVSSSDETCTGPFTKLGM